jgi:hypothetical protein
MTTVIQGSYKGGSVIEAKDYKYQYPQKLDLRPGTKVHSKIVNKVMDCAKASWDIMQPRHADWKVIDKTLTSYIHTSEYEKALKKSSPNKPISIVVPHSYSVMETILAYQTKAFLSVNPIFDYDGFSREDIIGAKLLSLLVDQQIRRLKSTLNIHSGLRNGLAYGINASPISWVTKNGRRPRLSQQSVTSSTGEILKTEDVIINEPTMLFEGSKIGTIDPYKYLPDPNVPPHMLQDGEFVGWIDEDSYLNLLSEERTQSGMFNVKYLNYQSYVNITSMFASDSARVKGKGHSKDSTGATRPITLINMYINIIPAELGLRGESEGNESGDYPEKWLFTLANDSILIFAGYLDLNHNNYPIAINAPDFDGFSIAPISRLEMNAGMQEVLNWLFNSHIQNVRKAINDMFIVDPSLLNMNDIENPEPGKLLRLRRAAWGRGVDGAIKQLQVTDVTQNNIAGAINVMDLMNRNSGAVDSLQGIMRSGGERRSAAEFNGTFNSAISRLEHLAYITSQMYLTDIAYYCASHTQQLMSQETYVRAIGEWPALLLEEYGEDLNTTALSVSPRDILVDFDVIFRDGTSMALDSTAGSFWSSMFDRMASNPELNQTFDIVRIFRRLARISGAKDVNQFVRKGGSIKAQQIGDTAALAQLKAGNLVPTAEITSTTGEEGE